MGKRDHPLKIKKNPTIETTKRVINGLNEKVERFHNVMTWNQ
jgi:hypothetical protein